MKFEYKIYDLIKKKSVKGKIEAENLDSAINYLKSYNNLIIEVKPEVSFSEQLSKIFFNKITFNDIVDFTRQFSIMLNAGLNIIDTFDILKKQTSKQSMLKLIKSIDEDIKSGSSLSNSLKKHSDIFDNLYISLVQSGEKSGQLAEILSKLADDLEKKREYASKIKSALAYPIVILITMVIVIFIVFTFIMPQLMKMFNEMNLDLPITTRVLMLISFFLNKNWPLVLLLVLLFLISVKEFLSTEKGKKIIDAKIISIPFFSKLIRMSNLVNSTRTLAILTKSGVSILESLEIVSSTATNYVYYEAFKRIYKKVEKGESIGRAFSEEKFFPPILIQMIQVGEETGHLDETLTRISKYFEVETEMAIKTLMSLIEPMILIILGIGVGFLVMSVISPIYQLTGSIK